MSRSLLRALRNPLQVRKRVTFEQYISTVPFYNEDDAQTHVASDLKNVDNDDDDDNAHAHACNEGVEDLERETKRFWLEFGVDYDGGPRDLCIEFEEEETSVVYSFAHGRVHFLRSFFPPCFAFLFSNSTFSLTFSSVFLSFVFLSSLYVFAVPRLSNPFWAKEMNIAPEIIKSVAKLQNLTRIRYKYRVPRPPSHVFRRTLLRSLIQFRSLYLSSLRGCELKDEDMVALVASIADKSSLQRIE